MPIKSISHEVEGSAQFKALFAIITALSSIPELFSLFSDSLYVVNLLPNLVEARIKLVSNPMSPLMIQAHLLLKQRINHIFLQYLRGHQNLPGFLSRGNQMADYLASMPHCNPAMEATHFHLLSHVNWRALKHRFPQIPV